MKVFISMPMKSKSVEQVLIERDRIFEYIKKKLPEAELINSVLKDADKDIASGGDDKGVWYLGKSIQLLSEADIVFFVNNWADFRGCSIERDVAEAYGKICVDLSIK